MPHEALWERCLFERGIDPDHEIMQFCLSRLLHDGPSTELVRLLNLHGLHQPSGEKWSLRSCHRLVEDNPLTTEQLEYGIQGQPPITAARILWRYARMGNTAAYHMAICRLWKLDKTMAKTAYMLNAYQGHSKGHYPIQAWDEETLLQYVLTHNLLDLTKEEHRKRIPLALAIKALNPSQKELFPKPVPLTPEVSASLTDKQRRQHLLQTYLTTPNPAQREQELAQNLMHCFLKERERRVDTVVGKQYAPLVYFLNQSELLKDTIPEWTPALMYDFLHSNGIMTKEDEFTMMDFPIMAEHFNKSRDYTTLAERCFAWLTNNKSNIGNLAKHLRKAGLTLQDGTQPTLAFVRKLLKEHGLTIPVPTTETQSEKSSRLIAIAAEGNSDDMKILIEHYLNESSSPIRELASRLKRLLLKQLDTEETLQTKLGHLGHDIWTAGGLRSFMQQHGIVTKAEQASATAKDPLADDEFLTHLLTARSNCQCLKVMNDRFGKNKPKDEFHQTLGEMLYERRIPPALSPAQIRAEYDSANDKKKLELKYELVLQILQEQAALETRGAQEISVPLKTLIYLHKTDGRAPRVACPRIKGYGIKIPEGFDHIPIFSNTRGHSSRKRPEGNEQGLPGTVNWMDGNIAKIFQFLDDNPFPDQEPDPSPTTTST